MTSATPTGTVGAMGAMTMTMPSAAPSDMDMGGGMGACKISVRFCESRLVTGSSRLSY